MQGQGGGRTMEGMGRAVALYLGLMLASACVGGRQRDEPSDCETWTATVLDTCSEAAQMETQVSNGAAPWCRSVVDELGYTCDGQHWTHSELEDLCRDIVMDDCQ